MAWIYLFAAGVFEIAWAVAMKQSFGMTRVGPTSIMVLAMLASVVLLSWSMRTLPLGTAYTVWTGIGAVGTFAVGVLFLDEATNVARLMAAALIIAGFVLMKMSTQ